MFRRFQVLCLEAGADWVPYLAGGADTEGYDDVISPAKEAPLKRGDLLMLDTGLVWDGYFCDYDRNWSIGAPSSGVKKLTHNFWMLPMLHSNLQNPGRWHQTFFML